MKPFFWYFGGKGRLAKRYPKPKYGKIIEPFAGAAGYAMKYASMDVDLYDVDPIVYGMWSYLIQAKPAEIRRLPADVWNVDDLHVCQELKWLVGYSLSTGKKGPFKRPSAWKESHPESNFCGWGASMRERIAQQLPYIRHWKIFNKSYESVPNEKATWFIDPPYVEAGKHYRYSFNDYKNLASFCEDRRGLTIVCEAEGAQWLPFLSLGMVRGQARKHFRKEDFYGEVVWVHDDDPKGVRWFTHPDML
jgi:site-specific DNA-adenine methylase